MIQFSYFVILLHVHKFMGKNYLLILGDRLSCPFTELRSQIQGQPGLHGETPSQNTPPLKKMSTKN
jgi:hypothetical protein